MRVNNELVPRIKCSAKGPVLETPSLGGEEGVEESSVARRKEIQIWGGKRLVFVPSLEPISRKPIDFIFNSFPGYSRFDSSGERYRLKKKKKLIVINVRLGITEGIYHGSGFLIWWKIRF